MHIPILNKKNIANGLIIGFFVLILIIIFYYFQIVNKSGKTNAQKIIHDITNDINKDLMDSEKGQESDGYLWWITDDGYNIQLTEAPKTTFKIKISSDFVSENNLNYVANQPYNKSLTKSVEQFLQKNGFKKNNKNSSKNEYDDSFYDYVIAYEKKEIVCTWNLNPDVYFKEGDNIIESELICSDKLQDNYNEQKNILDDLNLKDKEVIISINRKLDNFYYLNVHYRRSGYYIIAKEINGKFSEIHTGQEYIPCQKVSTYNIPKYIYKECL